ncbi:PREDICTED: group 3 secretory phospholipase A2-like isoform X1 [Cyprinodon variegatus]|uniref:phospholipase A2 n=1 Tax=Cyprinodon variegatus TaxID=28743 RepID=A0A3Q2D9B0_CYPVA|nr:PREDICTED: group 3 secretory phospholipase A2-like isoform X1 [Cyprinodon variegatus]
MENGWFLTAFFVLSWLALSKAQNTPGPGVSCLRWSPADGHILLTFLHQDPTGERSLYLTKWSDDLRLAECEINPNPDVTEGYHAYCNRTQTWNREIVPRFNISLLLSPDAPCAPVPSRNEETGRKTRRKRSWIFPGTLWCGTGSKAAEYEQLGMFERADKCCREHDHCSDIIPAFTVNYGVFNPNFFTVSHCECDLRFRQCLLGMNDSISSMVGYSFFNILKVPCFELKPVKRCTHMYWWGMCKKAEEAPYAIFKAALPYNSSDFTGKHVDSKNLTSSKEQNVSEMPSLNPQRKASESEHRCGLRDPPRGDTFHRRRTEGRGCKRNKKLFKKESSQVSTKPTKISNSKSKNWTRDRKKNRRDEFSGFTQKTNIPTTFPTTTSVQISPATTPSSVSALTLRPSPQKDLTKVKEELKKTKSKKKQPKQSKCCESNRNTSPLQCRSCLQPSGSPSTAAKPTKTKQLPAHHKKRYFRNKTGKPKQEALTTIRNAATFATPITKQKNASSPHPRGSASKKAGQNIFGGSSNQRNLSEKSLEKNKKRNIAADKNLQCRSLKHLDDCVLKIPPFEKKYNLTNMGSKTAYHCECITRLAVRIRSLKEPGLLRPLLEEFVSQDCFTLSKEKKCGRIKRCSGGFSKASDLHQALKKTEDKDFAAMRVSASGRKKKIPIHLYKYCLRLQMRADIMPQIK